MTSTLAIDPFRICAPVMTLPATAVPVRAKSSAMVAMTVAGLRLRIFMSPPLVVVDEIRTRTTRLRAIPYALLENSFHHSDLRQEHGVRAR